MTLSITINKRNTYNDDIQLNDTQHNNDMPLCLVWHFVYYLAECRHVECRYAECHGALISKGICVSKAFSSTTALVCEHTYTTVL